MVDLNKDDIDQISYQIFGQRSQHFKPMNDDQDAFNYYKISLHHMDVMLCASTNLKSLQKQFALLQKLWVKLPVARPHISYIGELNLRSNKVMHYIVTNFRSGVRFSIEDLWHHKEGHHIGFELGDFLGQLHQQSFSKFANLDHDLQLVDAYEFNLDFLNDQFAKLIGMSVSTNWVMASDVAKLEKEFAYKIAAIEDWGVMPHLIHGDIQADHLKISQGHLVEVSDWTQAKAAHPSFDFLNFVARFNNAQEFEQYPFLQNMMDQYFIYHNHLPKYWFDIVKLISILRDFSKIKREFTIDKQKQWFNAQMTFLQS